MSIDVSMIGIVFAVILFIIFFAAVVLYLSFRIKETFREEKRRGMLAVKIAFLIGILFLAGGSFYFFAQILSQPSPSTSPLPPSNGENDQEPKLTLYISNPKETRMNMQITITFTISNPTEYTAHDVFIQTNVLFEHFSLVSSTHKVTGNVIEIGDVLTGTTVVSLELMAPSRPVDIIDSITLTFKEMNEPLTEEISFSVRGKP